MDMEKEKFYCNPDECPTKNCECCWAKKTTLFDPTDNQRTGKGASPNGYYSGGLVRIVHKDGTVELNYARNPVIKGDK